MSSILSRLLHRRGSAIRPTTTNITNIITTRSMSMFLWRHVPVYRKEGTDPAHVRTRRRVVKTGWRLHPFQTKPAVPVRVDGLRSTGPTNKALLGVKHAVIMPTGTVKPFVKDPKEKFGTPFIDFWIAYKERWQQHVDYHQARAIPITRYCQRCDEPMNWLGRKPAEWLYSPIKAKRSIFVKEKADTYNHDDHVDDDDTDNDRPPEVLPPDRLEDRYCCPKPECGIREARIFFKQNVAHIDVLEGLTRKQWKPAKFGGNRLKSERAIARLAAIPFVDKGIPTDYHENPKTRHKAVYLNQVTDEQALKIVEHKAKMRYLKMLRGEETKFHIRPPWFTAPYGFRHRKNLTNPNPNNPIYLLDDAKAYRNPSGAILLADHAPTASKMIKSISEPVVRPACDECGQQHDPHPSACCDCGFILCQTCRPRAFPKKTDGGYHKHANCPGCSKPAQTSLDSGLAVDPQQSLKYARNLQRLIEGNAHDHRKKYWMQVVKAHRQEQKKREAERLRRKEERERLRERAAQEKEEQKQQQQQQQKETV